MPFTKTEFPGLMIFEPVVFNDSRGYFFESYNAKTCLADGVDIKFVQDNQARSVYGVVRGLHFQKNPAAGHQFLGGRVWSVGLRRGRGAAVAPGTWTESPAEVLPGSGLHKS